MSNLSLISPHSSPPLSRAKTSTAKLNLRQTVVHQAKPTFSGNNKTNHHNIMDNAKMLLSAVVVTIGAILTGIGAIQMSNGEENGQNTFTQGIATGAAAGALMNATELGRLKRDLNKKD